MVGEQDDDLGPTAHRLAKNLKQLREERGWSLTELSRRLTDIGQPMQPAAIRRIENAVQAIESEKNRKPRKVDVEDLIALAIALDVSPNMLLLPHTATEEPCELTNKVAISSRDAWRWAADGDADHGVPRYVAWRLGKASNAPQGRPFVVSTNPHREGAPSFRQLGEHVNEVWLLARRIRELSGEIKVSEEALLAAIRDILIKDSPEEEEHGQR